MQHLIHKYLLVGSMLFTLILGFAITPSFISLSTFRAIEQVTDVIPYHLVNLPKFSKQDEMCLTQAIAYEAGNQSTLGKEAVALVILNRVISKVYPTTICGVVHQSIAIADKRICQFSYYCQSPSRPNKLIWQESRRVAQKSLRKQFHRDILYTVGPARYFHADYVQPAWSKKKKFMGQIGSHKFYAEP